MEPGLPGCKKAESRPQNWQCFTAKVACAIEDNLDRYHYHDKGLTPAKKELTRTNRRPGPVFPAGCPRSLSIGFSLC